MRELLSTQHYTALDEADARSRFAQLDRELVELRAGQTTPHWYTRKVGARPPNALSLEHSSSSRDGFVYCETRIYGETPEPEPEPTRHSLDASAASPSRAR